MNGQVPGGLSIGVSPGGYNGGGPGASIGFRCGSGGGATHISQVYNPIPTDTIDVNGIYHNNGDWSNTDSVIAIASGAGSNGCSQYPANDNVWFYHEKDQIPSYGGASFSYSTFMCFYSGTSLINAYGHVSGSNNALSSGYARGKGQYCINSGGGGAGWYGGRSLASYSSVYQYIQNGAYYGTGCGGTSYVKPGYDNTVLIPGNDNRLIQDEYCKPNGSRTVHGYICVIKK